MKSKTPAKEPETALQPVRMNAPNVPVEWSETKPSWEEAKRLAGQIKTGVESVIKLGRQLAALRNQYFAQGARNELRNTPVMKCEKGWQAKVHDELGIRHMTALRIIERATYIDMLRCMASGEGVEYMDSRRQLTQIEATPNMMELATESLFDVESGTVNPKRAWAGVVGEGKRREHGGGLNRSPVNFAKVIDKAICSLSAALKHWRELEPEQRAVLENKWRKQVLAKLPDELTMQ